MDNEYEGDIFIEKEMREHLLALTCGNFALIYSFPQVFVHHSYVYQVRLNFRQKIDVKVVENLCKKDGGKWQMNNN